jgi:hypothetical protein
MADYKKQVIEVMRFYRDYSAKTFGPSHEFTKRRDLKIKNLAEDLFQKTSEYTESNW